MKRRVLASFLALILPAVAGSLTFEKTTLEKEVGLDALTAEFEFKFKNEGKEPVLVDHLDPAGPFLAAKVQGAMVIAPGQEGVIHATMDISTMTGTVDMAAAVFLKGDPAEKPSQVLTVRAKIPELVSVEPKKLLWEIGENPLPKKAVVTMNHSVPIKITSVTGADGKFAQEWKAIEEGKKYEVTVTPLATDQAMIGVLHVDTDCTNPRHKKRSLFVLVKKP